MTVELFPGHEIPESPLDANRRRVAQIIETEISDSRAAIEAANGSAIHHEAEIQLLQEMGERVSYLVGYGYEIEDPVDAQFIHEVIDFLKATDYSRDMWPDDPITRDNERQHIEEALGSLRRRNAGLPEAA